MGFQAASGSGFTGSGMSSQSQSSMISSAYQAQSEISSGASLAQQRGQSAQFSGQGSPALPNPAQNLEQTIPKPPISQYVPNLPEPQPLDQGSHGFGLQASGRNGAMGMGLASSGSSLSDSSDTSAQSSSVASSTASQAAFGLPQPPKPAPDVPARKKTTG